MSKKRVAILASGGGSNLQALIDAMKEPAFPAQAALIVSNKASSFALERGREAGVHTVFVNPAPFQSREEYDGELLRLMGEERVDLICLAGYMRILSPFFVRSFPKRILNIHPALLPKFGGEGMFGRRVHEAVLKSGEQESGCTVHLVDEGVDTGAILMQTKVPILPGDTPESLAARVLEQEHRIYPQALRNVCERL